VHAEAKHAHRVAGPAAVFPVGVNRAVVDAEDEIAPVRAGRRHSRVIHQTKVDALARDGIVLAQDVAEDVVQHGFGADMRGDREISCAEM